MYGKIFESIFKSTLVADGGWLPTYIFMSMIALADKDGIVDFAPRALFRHLGFRDFDSKIDFDEFTKAIHYLEAEDPESNSPTENGRRIIPLSETDIGGHRGWLIVNYLTYRKKASNEEPKGASTERVRRYRERNKNKDLQKGNGKETDETISKRTKRNGNGHTDTDKNTPHNPPQGGKRGPIGIKAFLKQCDADGVTPIPEGDAVFVYAAKVGIPQEFLELAWWEFVERNIESGKTYRDWRRAFRNCVRGNWYKLWYAQGDGLELTTQGVLAMRKHKEKKRA